MKKIQFGTRTILLTVLVVGLACSSIIFVKSTIERSTGKQQNNQTAVDANKVLWPNLRLPPSAKSISYYVDFGVCELSCTLSKNEFLSWCESKDWDFQTLTTSPTKFNFDYLNIEPDASTNGFLFYPDDGDGLYDEETERLFLKASTFP